MNVKLRKRHRYMWMVLGVALPLLCLEAIEVIPKNVIADIPRNYCPHGISTCVLPVHTMFQGEDNLEIRFDKDRLKLNLKSPLKSAFTLVYLSEESKNVEGANLLGQLNEMGKYEVSINKKDFEEVKYLILYDQLNDHVIFETQLSYF